MNPEAFVPRYLRGTAQLEDIDHYVAAWHDSDSKSSLHDFLGLSLDDYATWVQNPSRLEAILTRLAQEELRRVCEAKPDPDGQCVRCFVTIDRPPHLEPTAMCNACVQELIPAIPYLLDAITLLARKFAELQKDES